MSTVICPHCGATNFSISAYCTNCERPLQTDAKAPPQRQAAPRPPQAAPRPPAQTMSGSSTQSGTSSLPSSSQVAQQILQRRPPVPTASQSTSLPPAQQVAQQILQKRSAGADVNSEPTVIARVPVELQRALVGERSQAGQQQVVLQNRPPLQPRPIHNDLTRNPAAEDRTTPDADAATAVFTAPALLDKPIKPEVLQQKAPPKQVVPPPQPRPAAAPSLPQPAQARAAMPAQSGAGSSLNPADPRHRSRCPSRVPSRVYR